MVLTTPIDCTILFFLTFKIELEVDYTLEHFVALFLNNRHNYFFDYGQRAM